MTIRADLIVRDVGSETIVYDPGTHRAHCLEQTAAAVWRSWDGTGEPSEIARRVGIEIGERVDETSVRLVLRRLHRAGLIERPGDEAASKGGVPRRLGRRAALSRIGVAGLAVWSVAAPSPAQVTTCLANGQPCSRSSQCCSSCCNTVPNRCTGGGNCAPP